MSSGCIWARLLGLSGLVFQAKRHNALSHSRRQGSPGQSVEESEQIRALLPAFGGGSLVTPAGFFSGHHLPEQPGKPPNRNGLEAHRRGPRGALLRVIVRHRIDEWIQRLRGGDDDEGRSGVERTRGDRTILDPGEWELNLRSIRGLLPRAGAWSQEPKAPPGIDLDEEKKCGRITHGTDR